MGKSMKNQIDVVYYHVHTMLSNGVTNVDSVTDFKDYIKFAQECGMKALGFSEHGSIFHWVKKKESIEAAGMKYIHAIEAYLTENLTEKVRDNYHCVLIARNYDGVKELNKLVSKSFNRLDGHYYYMPRITFEELFNTSNNIIITTACLGGVLNIGTPSAKEKFLYFLIKNKHRCFLEIQHHNLEAQTEYNKLLYGLSKQYGIPLIAGTDTHALNAEHMEARKILQDAKGVYFSNEEKWELIALTPNELLQSYMRQKALPDDVIREAIHNTVVMAAMVEPFELDYSAKYPKLYDDSEAVFQEKINKGYKRRRISRKPNKQEYIDRIHYEFETYKHNNAIDFMLLEEDYKAEMRRRGVRYGYSRGSVSGSIIAYLLGITEVDSIKYNLNFERFMNRERVSLADVDSDWFSADRKTVKDYLYSKQGLYCCDIVTYNTIALKGAIKDIVRGLYNINIKKLVVPPDLEKKIKEWDKSRKKSDDGNEEMPEDIKREYGAVYKEQAAYKEVPFEYLAFANQLINSVESDEEQIRKKYPRIFKYVDLVNGVVVSVGNHPAGVVVSPYPVDEWFGTFTTSTDEYPISLINMKEIDSLNFVKLDILALDNIGLIYKTCDLAGIPYATPDNIPLDDINVWNSIKEDTTMIFQWESQSATAYLKQLFSDTTIERIRKENPNFSYMELLSIGNGAIRPAGESYRDQLAQGIYKSYGNKELDEFLKPTLGYLVYQEQIIEFLHKFCGFTMGEADVVRRHFSKKTGTDKDIPIIENGGELFEGHHIDGFIKTMKDKYNVPEGESKKLIGDFLQVIIDASDYLFSKNHADPYSMIGYICGYLRYYYPLEFLTSALNIFADKEEKSLAIIDYAKRNGINIYPIRFGHSGAEYTLDRENMRIFKGIASIKYMNSTIAEEMYELKDNHYEYFSDLMYDILCKTSVNSRQFKILIDLDFFSDFGDANFLRKIYDLYGEFGDRVQLVKEKLARFDIPFEIVRENAGVESPKMFNKVDGRGLFRAIEKTIHVKSRNLRDKMEAQLKHLGYIDIIGDEYRGMAVVTELDKKFSPRLKLYSLKNGDIKECKISKKVFALNPIREGDVIKVLCSEPRPKQRKTENGFEAVPGVFELWITKYRLIDL